MQNLFQKLMVGTSTAALVATMSTVAQAQDNGPDIEQVVVSASRVTIAGYSQPTPVTVIGAAQLEQDAYANIHDSIRQLPQVSAFLSLSQPTPPLYPSILLRLSSPRRDG